MNVRKQYALVMAPILCLLITALGIAGALPEGEPDAAGPPAEASYPVLSATYTTPEGAVLTFSAEAVETDGNIVRFFAPKIFGLPLGWKGSTTQLFAASCFCITYGYFSTPHDYQVSSFTSTTWYKEFLYTGELVDRLGAHRNYSFIECYEEGWE